LSRSGLQGARLEDIADNANISEANLFYYFTTKEAIYLAVLMRTLDQWLTPLRDFTVEGDPVEEIITYITDKWTFTHGTCCFAPSLHGDAGRRAALRRHVARSPEKARRRENRRDPGTGPAPALPVSILIIYCL
jgi:AcrR family transcriptional regulator